MIDKAADAVGVIVGLLVLAGAAWVFLPSRTNIPARQRASRWLWKVIGWATLAFVMLAALYKEMR